MYKLHEQGAYRIRDKHRLGKTDSILFYIHQTYTTSILSLVSLSLSIITPLSTMRMMRVCNAVVTAHN